MKTKSFKKYLEKRLDKDEIAEINGEVKLVRKKWKCKNAFTLDNNKEKFIEYMIAEV